MDALWTPTVAWFTTTPLPAEVTARTRQLVLDTMACAIAGTRHEEVRRLGAVYSRTCPGEYAFPGQPSACAPSEAAALFTSAACWDEYCEGNEHARGRPGLHSVGLPVILGRTQGATVGDVLRAVALGYEVGARFGAALFTRQGFHVDGMWGTAAAAASAAAVMGLPEEQIVEAIGIAATTVLASQYLSVAQGATARNVYAARGVSGGFASALAASAGITAPTGATSAAIELLGRSDASAPFAEPGEFLLLDGYFKHWPGVRHAHYAVAAALQLRERLGGVPDDIGLAVHPAAVEYAGVRAPESMLQAQFSCTYAVAYALLFGTLDVKAFEPQALSHPRLRALEQRIDLTAGARASGRYARLSADGQEVFVDSIPGDPGRPITEAQTRSKALRLMTPQIGEAAAVELAEWVLGADLADPWRGMP